MRITRVATTIATLGAAAATSALLAGPALAAPGGVVPRMEQITIEATLSAYVTTENYYTATLNTSTGEFSGTGTLVYNGHTYTGIESISGTYQDGTLSFTASYGNVGLGVSDATVTNGSFSTTGFRIYNYGENSAYSKQWPMTGTVAVTPNHGAYVRTDPGTTAARSSVGMPLMAVR